MPWSMNPKSEPLALRGGPISATEGERKIYVGLFDW